MVYYFYKLTIYSGLLGLLGILRSNLKKRNHYYINITLGGKCIALILKVFFNIYLNKLNFELRSIRDNSGELIRIRIPRKDLFQVKDSIINTHLYKNLIANNCDKGRIRCYLEKSILEGAINAKNITPPKTLYLINVVSQLHKRKGYSMCSGIK